MKFMNRPFVKTIRKKFAYGRQVMNNWRRRAHRYLTSRKYSKPQANLAKTTKLRYDDVLYWSKKKENIKQLLNDESSPKERNKLTWRLEAVEQMLDQYKTKLKTHRNDVKTKWEHNIYNNRGIVVSENNQDHFKYLNPEEEEKTPEEEEKTSSPENSPPKEANLRNALVVLKKQQQPKKKANPFHLIL
jgi:hypothetical protein